MEDADLEIRASRVGPMLYVAFVGELDIQSSQKVEPTRLLDGEERMQSVEVDLTGLRYIDSSGVMSLVQLSRAARERGVTLSVRVRKGSLIERVLLVTGVDEIFPVAAVSGQTLGQ